MTKKPALKFRTISSALFSLVCICVIPAVLVSIAAISFYYAQERAELLASSVRRATAVSANVDATIKGVEIGLLTLSHSPTLANRDFLHFHAQARATLGDFSIARNIYLMTPDGRQLINTTLPYGADLPMTRNPELIERVVATHKLAVSDVFMGSVAHAPLVAIAVPVVVDGKVAYVLGATISPEAMTRVLLNSTPPSDWIIAAHDSKSHFLARSHEIGTLAGRPASDSLRAAMALRADGTLEGVTREGIPVYAAYTKSKFTGWTVSVGIPKAKLLANLNKVILAAIVVAALAAAIGSAAAMALAVHIRRSITALVPPAEALSRSEPVVLPPETFAETHAVAVGSSRVDLQACKLEYSIVSPK